MQLIILLLQHWENSEVHRQCVHTICHGLLLARRLHPRIPPSSSIATSRFHLGNDCAGLSGLGRITSAAAWPALFDCSHPSSAYARMGNGVGIRGLLLLSKFSSGLESGCCTKPNDSRLPLPSIDKAMPSLDLLLRRGTDILL